MKFEYESKICAHIIGLIRQKRADGFSYTTEEYHLKRLDEFYLAFFPDESTVTREIASKWPKSVPPRAKTTATAG